MDCELVDPDGLRNQLKILKSAKVDGIMVDCWWGIVESHTPQQYNWSGYRKLFQLVHDVDLKLQVSDAKIISRGILCRSFCFIYLFIFLNIFKLEFGKYIKE